MTAMPGSEQYFSEEPMSPMKQEKLNGSVTEAVINTLVSSQIEVPNTNGAKSVFLDYVEMDCTVPGAVAGTTTVVEAAVYVGKVTPTVATLDAEGVIAARQIHVFPQAAAAVVESLYSCGEEPMCSPVVLLPHVDGKYYVTVAVKGSNCGAGDLMSCKYHMRFRVDS